MQLCREKKKQKKWRDSERECISSFVTASPHTRPLAPAHQRKASATSDRSADDDNDDAGDGNGDGDGDSDDADEDSDGRRCGGCCC